MATLISDYNPERKYKNYGKAALFGTNIRGTIPYLIIAKGNVFEGIEAKE